MRVYECLCIIYVWAKIIEVGCFADLITMYYIHVLGAMDTPLCIRYSEQRYNGVSVYYQIIFTC